MTSVKRAPWWASAGGVLVSGLLAVAGPVAAQSGDGPDRAGSRGAGPEALPRPVARAAPAGSRIVVDGRLDEPAWRAAPELSDFVQAQPDVGRPASERTVVRVLFDAQFIYVGAICYDSEPDKVTSVGLDQDFDTHNSDVFGMAFDTYHDGQNSFTFGTNPAGALFDAQTFDDSKIVNRAWEGVVYLKTAVHDSGWTAEFAIPLTTLRFQSSPGEQRWGVNFLRRVRRRNEESYWAPLYRYHRVHSVSLAGALTGLTGLKQGRNLSIKPFALSTSRAGELPAADQRGTSVDGGVDLKYGLTSRVTLDLTYRTDFSQVEVDEQQVNLTRFSLFFPEKRDFFMENAGVFAFGDVSLQNSRLGSSPRDFSLFHSRRIGLRADGQPVPIQVGGRLTGRVGPLDIGLLDMQAQATAAGPAENFGVARLTARVLAASTLGAIVINREATDGSGAYNRSYGADALLRFFDHLWVNAYGASTEAPGGGSDHRAGNVLVAWRDQVLDVSGFAKQVGAAFDPGVGFIRRRAVREGYGTVGVHARPSWASLQEVNPYAEVDVVTNLAGALETRQLTAGVDAEFRSSAVASLTVNDRYERLTEDFEVVPGAVVAPGVYGFRDVGASLQSDRGRSLSAGGGASYGGFYDGTKATLTFNGVWRPNYHLATDLTAEHNAVRLPQASFTADVYRARVRYAYSTRFFASAFVQYNTVGDELSVNARLNYLHAPLSDLFLVYTERRDLAGGRLLDRAVTAKVTRMLAF